MSSSKEARGRLWGVRAWAARGPGLAVALEEGLVAVPASAGTLSDRPMLRRRGGRPSELSLGFARTFSVKGITISTWRRPSSSRSSAVISLVTQVASFAILPASAASPVPVLPSTSSWAATAAANFSRRRAFSKKLSRRARSSACKCSSSADLRSMRGASLTCWSTSSASQDVPWPTTATGTCCMFVASAGSSSSPKGAALSSCIASIRCCNRRRSSAASRMARSNSRLRWASSSSRLACACRFTSALRLSPRSSLSQSGCRSCCRRPPPPPPKFARPAAWYSCSARIFVSIANCRL
mmetsp:Transcript_23534/g.66176  ORF Transcript_23534/g.66176 Transcript_23534/m.66176 type:complete len:297 (+) Transcript_23534:469-1359(+)